MTRPNSFSQRLPVPLTVSAVTLLLLEIASWTVFPRLTGKQLDFVRLTPAKIRTDSNSRRTTRPTERSVHPSSVPRVFGSADAPIGPREVPVFNSYGLWRQPGRPFPYKRRRERVCDRRFGGKCGAGVCCYGRRGRPTRPPCAGPTTFSAERKSFSSRLATGGYKQPQGLFLLQLAFLSGFDIDAVLNVDGFNELVFAVENLGSDYNPLFPSAYHLGLLQKGHLTGFDEDTAKTIILLRSAERNQLRLTRLLAAFPFRYSATANILEKCHPAVGTTTRQLGTDHDRTNCTGAVRHHCASRHERARPGGIRGRTMEGLLADGTRDMPTPRYPLSSCLAAEPIRFRFETPERLGNENSH